MADKVHIGKKIKEVLTQSRLKKTEFADLINISRTVVYDIFKRETIDTGLLQTISKVLNHDFFGYYDQLEPGQVKEPKSEYGFATKYELTEVVQSVKLLAKEIEKLREELPKKKAAPKKKYGKGSK